MTTGRQLSLVALLRQKPDALVDLIRNCQERLTATLDVAFQPYALPQIHATIVGMERVEATVDANLNIARYHQTLVPMDFSGLLAYLRGGAAGHLPLRVQIGGFADRDYHFTSRGQRPFLRSFSIQQDRVVLMGFPCNGGPLSDDAACEPSVYTMALDQIRRDCQAFNILHKYHISPHDRDNDLFFRIGIINCAVSQEGAIRQVEQQIRHFAGSISPIMLELTSADLCIVAYADETFPPGTTVARQIDDPELTSEVIRRMYA